MDATDGYQEGSTPPEQHSPKPWFRISDVFHPFDPRDDNEVAFVHALRVAWFARARLTLLCLRQPENQTEADRRPQARATLQRWSMQNPLRRPGEEDPNELIIRALHVASQEPVQACVRFLKDNPADLIVLAAPRGQGKVSWLRESATEALARKTGEMTLFIPRGAQGFVSRENGAVSLKRILIPIAVEPSPEPAVEAARRLMLSVPQEQGSAVLLHVGSASSVPDVWFPDVPGWTWELMCRGGEVVDTILGTAAAIEADLIAMSTFGTYGFLDVLRGTVSQQILSRADCPLLAMPEGSFLG